MERPKVVIIMGATGTGKSKLAIDLASHFPIEIINADSMQVYKGLDILSNKVPIQDQKGVPHHLLGTISPNVEFTSKHFRDSAVQIIDEIIAREKLPVIVGGTNYYIQALVSPFLLDDFVQEIDDCSLKGAEIGEYKFEEEDSEYSADYQRLKAVDPDSANRIHPNDSRKVNIHMGGLVSQVETLSRKYDSLNQRFKVVEKERDSAIKARDIAKTKVSTEMSKNTALEKDNEGLQATRDQLTVEKASLVDEHQRRLKELEDKVAEAENEANEADEVTKTWNAAADMFENVLSNLYQMVSTKLSAEDEATYRGWLATINLPVREPKEVKYIAPEAYDSDATEDDERAAAPAGETTQEEPRTEGQETVIDANIPPPAE